MNLRQAIVLAGCLGLTACTSPNLFVADEEGKPIGGAEIHKIYPSFQGLYTTTDQNGAARIGVPSPRPDFPYYVIQKSGYRSLEIRAAPPLHVTLFHPLP